MATENTEWENVSPVIERTQEDFFGEWAALEQKFGELGAPGYSEQVIPVRFFDIFGHNDFVNIRFTLLRGDDGGLLCVHGCYIKEGVQKPFLFNVHPDHQRQGIGTMVADYIIARFESENNKQFTYKESWGSDVIYTPPSANFVNKYVQTD